MPPATPSGAPRFYGKYRGLVVNNLDPQQLGRVQVEVPDVLGAITSLWAMPCVPVAGVQSGCFVVSPVGSQIWVEFESGDRTLPIWTGGFWTSASEVPAFGIAALPAQSIVLQTSSRNMAAISDADPTAASGGIILTSAGGATIVVNDSGIYISNGKGASITLVGPSVTIDGLVTEV